MPRHPGPGRRDGRRLRRPARPGRRRRCPQAGQHRHARRGPRSRPVGADPHGVRRRDRRRGRRAEGHVRAGDDGPPARGSRRGRRHEHRPGPLPLPRHRRRAGRGLPAVRLRHRHRPGAVRVGGQRRRTASTWRSRATRPRSRSWAGGWRPTRHRSPWSRTSWRPSCRRRAARASPSSSPIAAARPAYAPWPVPTWPPAPTACASSPTRPTGATATRSSRAPTAAPGSPSSPTCPTTGRRRRWPASRCAPPARRSTPTLPTAASTPSRSPAPTAVRSSSWCDPTPSRAAVTRRSSRPGGCWPAAPSWRSRDSAATTWPATRGTRGRWRSCAGASVVATSRSR